MKKEDILDSLKYLDDKLLNEADELRVKEKKSLKGDSINRWIAAAAAVLIALSVAGYLKTTGKAPASDPIVSSKPEIPNWLTLSVPVYVASGSPIVLDIEENNTGSGITALMAEDISEIQENCPWSGQSMPETLPVFKNPVKLVLGHFPQGYDINKMKELMNEVLRRLKTDPSSVNVTDDAKTPEQRKAMEEKLGSTVPDSYMDPTVLKADTAEYHIEVNYRYDVTISFKEKQLPDGYGSTSAELTQKTAEFIKTEYSDIISMKDPCLNITGGDSDRFGVKTYDISFYEKGSDLKQSILNNDFRSVRFFINEGDLKKIYIKYTDVSDVVSDYRTITVDEAKELRELLRLIEVGASCFNHYCIGYEYTQLNVLHSVRRRIS